MSFFYESFSELFTKKHIFCTHALDAKISVAIELCSSRQV